MKCSEVIQKLTELAPESLACDWDNSGLLVGRRDQNVEKILLVVDVTEEVVDFAVSEQVDLIVSHHPLIFGGQKRITSDDVFGRRLLKLIRHDISCYAMHTNYDRAEGGMADAAAKCLRLTGCQTLEPEISYETPTGVLKKGGIGKVGLLPHPVTAKKLAQLVKERFGLDAVRLFGDPDSEAPISKVAICPGAGRSFLNEAMQAGAQAYITGDIGHHDGLDAREQGLVVLDAGHFGIEQIFTEEIESYLREQLSAEVAVLTMTGREPFVSIV